MALDAKRQWKHIDILNAFLSTRTQPLILQPIQNELYDCIIVTINLFHFLPMVSKPIQYQLQFTVLSFCLDMIS